MSGLHDAPAFPIVVSPQEAEQGMSLWDYFAGQALAGMCAHPDLGGKFQDFASDAANYADALMVEREKRISEAKARDKDRLF